MTDVNTTETTKRYEDFTDDDVADVLASREESRKENHRDIPAGLYFSKVKVMKEDSYVQQKGIFAGAKQVLLGIVPFTNPDDNSSELKNGIVWYRFALPLAAPGQKMSAQARGISVGALQALGLVQRTDDEAADVRAARQFAIDVLEGSGTMVGATAYTDITWKSYTNGKGEERRDANVRFYGTLSKNKSLTAISATAS